MTRKDLIPPSPAEDEYAAMAKEPPLDEGADPLSLFADWLAEAKQKEPNDAHAMALATADADGLPDVRMVLLKDFDERGFVFFTNLESAKGQELAANPQGALLFHWKSLRRQVRLRGKVEPVSAQEADAYFATRARSSQIGAWASDQSRPMPSRHALEKRVAEFGLKFGLSAPPRPPHWSGFRLAPEIIEFWRDRPFRLHERLQYARVGRRLVDPGGCSRRGFEVMQMRSLGRSGLSIAPLIFGGNVFGWTADESTSHGILDAYVDAGFNAVDTADVYGAWAPAGFGASETVIGTWFKASGKRDKVVLATKVGWRTESGELNAAHIEKAVEASLKRLQTDYIDLYQSHKDDPSTSQEETMEAFARLVKAGKVRAIGSSNFTPERIRSANAIAAAIGGPRYETEQPEYNLMVRKVVEPALADLAAQDGIGLIPYFGLAAGFLTGKYRSEADLAQSPRGARAKAYLNAKGLSVLGALDMVAARHGATPAQVALAWQLAKPFIAAPIASATSVEQLHEILPAVDLKLEAEDVAQLDAASAT